MAIDTKEMLELIDSLHTVLSTDGLFLEVILIGIHLELILCHFKTSISNDMPVLFMMSVEILSASATWNTSAFTNLSVST